ncbi:hypothetical protein IFM89_005670 [Coptis chinensis]|uniref:Uncharacterized protein n=1 Tax=Coptis chinensis TaxID=261450 RepID=A0A835GUH3_9MAGN|nr:hypothetical protein IFM89_005670 [Coptis chinensis]
MEPTVKPCISIFFLISVIFYITTSSYVSKTPFHPKDILPFLPRQLSWLLLNNLNSAVDILPTFVGSASSPNVTLGWKGACFYNTTAWMEFHNKSGSEYGGGTLHIKTAKAHSWTCMDLYIFATPYRVTWDYYFLGRQHTLEFKEWEGKEEYEYGLFKLYGMSSLYSQIPDGVKAQILHFLRNTCRHPLMNVLSHGSQILPLKMSTRGDFLAISKSVGRWGGFETLEKWVTGAYAGHTAVLLKDPEGKLWVGESGHENEKGEDVVAVLPWDEWWEFELTKDDANPQIALLPLRPDLRAKFNESAAWEYAKSMSGQPYGYHNLIFSWIDTVDGNYPPPLDAHLVASVMTVWNHIQPAYAANMWNEALNKRLGTKGLDLPDILVETEKRGLSFDKLLTIPEQDNWVYSDGKSTSCVVFILEMYKQAGLFDPIASSIQATEFTIKDTYTLNFFESNPSRLPKWCNAGDSVKLPFCQIRGKYRMELPGYNTMKPYPHMNERCPSLPPDYRRVQNC